MKEQIVQSVKDTRVVAIIRGMAPEICAKLAESYRSGGIRLVEVTFDQTGDLRKTVEAIRAIRARRAEMNVSPAKKVSLTIATQEQETFAAGAGYEQVELTVETKNRRAVSLYHRFGFTVYGTRPHGMKYPDGSYDNDYLMVRMLSRGTEE